jgi:hypothetical protein
MRGRKWGRGKEAEDLVLDWQDEVQHEDDGELHKHASELDVREQLYIYRSFQTFTEHSEGLPGY